MTANNIRRKIPKKIEAKLLVDSRSTCNICRTSINVQIHHIVPIGNGGNNDEENLIVLCPNCHSEVHSNKSMCRNLSVETLLLYKESWVDLVKRNPYSGIGNFTGANDITIITEILKQGYRRALYFPMNHEEVNTMFNSLESLRVHIQSSGYKLVSNHSAREHIHQLYNITLELLMFNSNNHFMHRGFDMMGFEDTKILSLFDMKRKEACFHLNELAYLIGVKKPIISDTEFEDLNFNLSK